MVFEDEELSYCALDARANQLAHHLRALGVGPETVVGLCVARSPQLIVALLGILKAGGAYLPLDPDYPTGRLAFMLADAGARVLISESAQSRIGWAPTMACWCGSMRTREKLRGSPRTCLPCGSTRIIQRMSSTPQARRESRRAWWCRTRAFLIWRQPRSSTFVLLRSHACCRSPL